MKKRKIRIFVSIKLHQIKDGPRYYPDKYSDSFNYVINEFKYQSTLKYF